jgi:hypothetical protein
MDRALSSKGFVSGRDFWPALSESRRVPKPLEIYEQLLLPGLPACADYSSRI